MINDLFTYKLLEKNEEKIKTEIAINYGHRLFEGHFPRKPILPGVCQLYAVKQTMEQALDILLQMNEASVLKFQRMITPETAKELICNIDFVKDEDNFKTQATLSDKTEQIFFKLKANFRKK